jgi:hypothetical protein
MLHHARELLVRQKTILHNALRGHCAEFGVVVTLLTDLSNVESRTDERKSRALLGLIENVQITPGKIRSPIMAKAIAGQLAVEHKRNCNEHQNIDSNFHHSKRGV